jgi:hypothetical protein
MEFVYNMLIDKRLMGHHTVMRERLGCKDHGSKVKGPLPVAPSLGTGSVQFLFKI